MKPVSIQTLKYPNKNTNHAALHASPIYLYKANLATISYETCCIYIYICISININFPTTSRSPFSYSRSPKSAQITLLSTPLTRTSIHICWHLAGGRLVQGLSASIVGMSSTMCRANTKGYTLGCRIYRDGGRNPLV